MKVRAVPTQGLFSLGYSGVRFEAVTQWLDQHDALLVDVRFKPFSRNPQWRQSYLQRVLGPRYWHVPELGNLNYKGGRIQLMDEAAGVRTVSEMLERTPVALLCVCSDHATCHRTVAAEAIKASTSVTITHLTPADFGPAEQLDLLTSYHRVTS